jgi:hypothetical protein
MTKNPSPAQNSAANNSFMCISTLSARLDLVINELLGENSIMA